MDVGLGRGTGVLWWARWGFNLAKQRGPSIRRSLTLLGGSVVEIAHASLVIGWESGSVIFCSYHSH